MRQLKSTAQYRRDLKRLQRQGKEIDAMRDVVQLLIDSAVLPSRYLDHPLKGNWIGHRELHLEGDWLLIYKVTDDAIHLVRTGSHAELLKR